MKEKISSGENQKVEKCKFWNFPGKGNKGNLKKYFLGSGFLINIKCQSECFCSANSDCPFHDK